MSGAFSFVAGHFCRQDREYPPQAPLITFSCRPCRIREVGPEVVGLLLVLDAGEHHLGAGDLRLRVLDVFEELILVPGDAGILVGLGIGIPFDGAGLTAVDPFSSGPTLFLAPSPIAWQARHLLKEVLPAAASCASALDAVAIEAMTIRALEVGFFMGCSSSSSRRSGASACGMAGSEWTSHETLTGFMLSPLFPE